MFLEHRLCFPIGVCIWALLLQPPTSPDFSAIDVMAAGCAGLHRHQGGREGGRTSPHGFRSENWLAHPAADPGGVMWVLADVVGDVHLATKTSPGFCRPGLSWAAVRSWVGISGSVRVAPRILSFLGSSYSTHEHLQIVGGHHFLDSKRPRIAKPQTLWVHRSIGIQTNASGVQTN